MRKPIIIANWKMNKTKTDAIDLINKLKNIDLDEEVETVICVPSLYGILAKDLLENSNIKVGIQNMFYEESGAYTGEISPTMLNSCGITHVILGHSERRIIFKENDTDINSKVDSALKHNLTVILCCGETLEERQNGKENVIIENQLRSDLKNINIDNPDKLIIAYEPIWAIGTGLNASSNDAEKMIKYIRSILRDLYGDKADYIRIQYGGSVKPNNIKELMNEENIDGALVGGASLDSDSFSSLVNFKK